MTRTNRPDGNSGQIDITNPEFRHLSDFPPQPSGDSLVTLLPLRYLQSTTYEYSRDEGSARGDSTPINVGAADADRTPSQKAETGKHECADKGQTSTRKPTTQKLYVLYKGGLVEALVDSADAKRLGGFRWYLIVTKQGKRYVAAHVPGGLTYLHREVLGVSSEITVDHKNGDTLDNRRENLRVATSGQQRANSKKLTGRNCTSKYKGVSKPKKSRRWRAHIKLRSLGSFETEVEAAHAYDRAALIEFGEFARLNFPAVNPAVVSDPEDSCPRRLASTAGDSVSLARDSQQSTTSMATVVPHFSFAGAGRDFPLSGSGKEVR